MVQRLLSSAEFKMDPLVSLYYYAPACAVTNGFFTLFTDIPRMTMNDIYSLGISTLIANALVAFLLNVSVVLLVCCLVASYGCRANKYPDWPNLGRRSDNGRRAQGHPPCLLVDDHLR